MHIIPCYLKLQNLYLLQVFKFFFCVVAGCRFAYGSKGEEDRVPCNMSLLCTVKLVDFKPEDSPEDLTVADRQRIG